MSDWKAERLSSFMEITGIEDKSKALTIIEKYKWDLNNAVTAVVDNKSDSDVEIIEDSSSRKTRKSERTSVSKSGSSSSSHYATSRDVNFGSSGRSSRSHRSSLDSSNSSSSGTGNNNLLSNSRRSKSIIFEKPKKCTFLIHDKNKLKTYNMDFKWDVTVQKVKNDVYSLTDIPVGNQLWQGWPDFHTNDSKLSELDLKIPVHELSVSARYPSNDRFATGPSATMTSSTMAASFASVPNATITSGSFAAGFNSSSKNDPITVQSIDSDDSEEYDYSMENDEAIFKNITNKDPLISDNVESEVAGSLEFSKQFENRYGPCHPDFYVGSLEDAMKFACAKPVKERKILAIYLHHDQSVLSNVFCSQLLGCEAVLQMFQENFVVWGWDVTFDSNRKLLIESISERLGSAGFGAIRTMPINRFPLTVLIMQNRSSTEIHTIIYGDVSVNELSSRLIEAVDVFTSYQNKELRDEQERNARELVKLEQDIAFNESLQNDRAKEEARHKQAALEREKQQKQIEELQEKQRRFEQEQNLARMRLAPEPPVTTAQSDVCFFRFKSPTNEVFERRFLRKSNITSIFDFLIINGFSIEDYKVLLNWPKRDLTTFDPQTLLEDLKLNRQEVGILEKR